MTSEYPLNHIAKEPDEYKEKFKEYELAASRLEQLLKNKPEERLVLPAVYNL